MISPNKTDDNLEYADADYKDLYVEGPKGYRKLPDTKQTISRSHENQYGAGMFTSNFVIFFLDRNHRKTVKTSTRTWSDSSGLFLTMNHFWIVGNSCDITSNRRCCFLFKMAPKIFTRKSIFLTVNPVNFHRISGRNVVEHFRRIFLRISSRIDHDSSKKFQIFRS